MRASMDITYEVIQKYLEVVEKKKGICKIMPEGRFHVADNGLVSFQTLVCDDRMGGLQTGVSAEHCANCILKKEE